MQLRLDELRVTLAHRELVLQQPVALSAGRLYLVTGPSGSGKSAFARALLGFGELVVPPTPTRGQVTLVTPAGSLPIHSRQGYHSASREEIAFLPQAERLGFLDGLTTLENLSLFSHLPAQAGAEQARQLASRFHLANLPTHLSRASGGERIRLSAVRGLLPRRPGGGLPRLVIADEPTAGLDPRAARALADELVELATGSDSLVLVITHEPHWFVERDPGETAPLPPIEAAAHPPTASASNPVAADPLTTDLVPTHPVATQPLATHPVTAPPQVLLAEVVGEGRRSARVVGRLELQAAGQGAGVASSRGEGAGAEGAVGLGWGHRLWAAFESVGSVVLAPLALAWSLLWGRRLGRAARVALADGLHLGTQLFALAGSLLVATTVAYFIFEQTPRPELVEPLLLPEILKATGHTLVRVVLPLAACTLVATKLGAAQAARLAAGVRQGLLETLALARWPIENYALLPAVAAQVVAMTVATAVCLAAGVVAASLVYTLGHARAPLPLSVDLLLSGLRNAPGWEWYLAAKVLSSGLLAGTIAAWCGGTPGSARDDVAEAVHRTLLWGVLCVIACQCVWIIAEFANQP